MGLWARRGARVASICTGAFVLAASGLLDGKRATTHWLAAPALSGRYPTIDAGLLAEPAYQGARAHGGAPCDLGHAEVVPACVQPCYASESALRNAYRRVQSEPAQERGHDIGMTPARLGRSGRVGGDSSSIRDPALRR